MADDGELKAQVDAREKEVQSLLSRSNYSEALAVALRDPPLLAKDQAIKVSLALLAYF